jgi:hypothetical protein
VSENRVLSRIFGQKRDEETGGWRNLHNEELHNLYTFASIIRMSKSRRLILPWHVARMVEKRNAYRTLVGKPEGKRALGRPRRGWVDNNKIDHREIRYGAMECTDLVQDRDYWRDLVSTVMNFRVP